jgi:hypothetical protein
MPASGNVIMAGQSVPESRPAEARWSAPWIRWAARVAGPALIVLGPAIVLHDFWLGSRLSTQQVDLLPFWLPRWCFLGRALASAHIPTWLPNQFAGVPFASDPQSGWLYLPAMLFFSTLSCARALGVVILLNPILAGLGLYVFFRHEGLGRPAATVGGVTLGLSMCGSLMVLSMPFAGALAWTAVALAGASGYAVDGRPHRRIAWLGVTGLALAQVAGAHLTNGLLMAGLILILYLIARGVVEARAGRRRAWSSFWGGAGLVAALPVLGAAVLLPRLALLPRTTIGKGYGEMARVTAQLSGIPLPSPFVSRGLSVWWGTSFTRGPGGYVGVLAILLVAVALASKRWRWPAAAFGIAGLIGWVLNLDVLIRQPAVRRAAIGTSWGELWLRDPSRFRYLLVVAFAALAGYGTQAWLDMPGASGAALARRAVWFAPPLVVLVLAPVVAGSPVAPYVPVAIGAVVAVPVLLLASRGTGAWKLAIPAVAFVELLLVGMVGLGPPGHAARPTTAANPFDRSFPKLHRPDLPAGSFLDPGPIGRALLADRSSSGRYVTFDPQRATQQVTAARPPSLRIVPSRYEDGQSILLGLDEIQGYSPVQLDRYWRLVRRVDRIPLFYNAATFRFLTPEILELFGVRSIIATEPLRFGFPAVAREGRQVLYRVQGSDQRASVVFSWRRAPQAVALDAVLAPGFDPAREAVVEEEPHLGGSDLQPGGVTSPALATYEERSPEDVVVRTTTSMPGLLVVRNAFDDGWHATVDGHPATVLHADSMMQAVPVAAGRHTVELKYRDPAIGTGLVISMMGWLVLGGLGSWLTIRERRALSSEVEPSRVRSRGVAG